MKKRFLYVFEILASYMTLWVNREIVHKVEFKLADYKVY